MCRMPVLKLTRKRCASYLVALTITRLLSLNKLISCTISLDVMSSMGEDTSATSGATLQLRRKAQ